MANLVNQIFDAVKTIVAAETGYSELKRRYNIDNNDIRAVKTGYAVTHGSGSNTDTVTRAFTIDQTFEVVLTTTVTDRVNDENIQDAINVLYDKADDVLKEAMSTKLGLPAIVLNVMSPGYDAPELLSGNEIVVLRFRFDVKYRSSINA